MQLRIIVCYLLLIYLEASICLQIVGVSIPNLKQRGESVTMTCDYDLEGGKLYSVKWYKDNEEFYRYMPRLKPPQHSHRVEGVKVDMERSSARRVHLRDLTLKSRGLYRCEVSEEAPSFHSAQSEAFMEVYYISRENPRIVGYERLYQIHEPLDVNCSSAKAFPPPLLEWHVDGQLVTEPSWLIEYEPAATSQGFFISTLGLRAPAKPHLRLKCVAILANHKRERTIFIQTNSSPGQLEASLDLIIIFIVSNIIYQKIS
ncbi:uncharacterized protein LOC123695082 [Colias croceus]|uniref:uncharacterized protein LOC123695082 n=1 Tax=Colias crocea TaxID=72248 RepID=UPI001E28122A|nr:uncharacterized protein LOC123695082 [Colias croceus]